MVVGQSVTLGVMIFLQWQLGLHVFGLFALSVVFIDLLHQQGRSACEDAIMQARDFSAGALTGALLVMLGVLCLVVPVLMIYGQVIAAQQNEPMLRWMVPALALTLLPLPFGVPPTAKLNHALDFRGIALRGVLAALLGGIAAVVVALGPFAIWALVAQRAVSVLASVAFLMVRAGWFPAFAVDWGYMWRFAKNAGRIFAAQGLGAGVMPVMYLVTGRFFGLEATGALRIAAKITEIVYGAFAAPMGSLWVILQTRRDFGPAERRDLYTGLSKMLALICLPVFVGGALIADDLVALAFNDAALVGTLLRVLCLIGLMSPLFYFRNHAFTALGHLNRLLAFSAIDVGVTVLAALAGVVFGWPIEAVVATLGVHFALTVFLFLPQLLRDMSTDFLSIMRAITPGYVGSFAMVLVVFIVSNWTADAPVVVRLVTKIAAGAWVYSIFLIGFHRDWFFTALKMLGPQRPAPVPAV